MLYRRKFETRKEERAALVCLPFQRLTRNNHWFHFASSRYAVQGKRAVRSRAFICPAVSGFGENWELLEHGQEVRVELKTPQHYFRPYGPCKDTKVTGVQECLDSPKTSVFNYVESAVIFCYPTYEMVDIVTLRLDSLCMFFVRHAVDNLRQQTDERRGACFWLNKRKMNLQALVDTGEVH